jgi:hypothetical protein
VYVFRTDDLALVLDDKFLRIALVPDGVTRLEGNPCLVLRLPFALARDMPALVRFLRLDLS